MSENVYANGVRFTPEEYKLLQDGLVEIAFVAKENGKTNIYNRCMDLRERLQQYVFAGKGIPAELDKDFAEKFQEAVMDNNSKAYIVTLRRWIAARIRLEVDPAKAVSELVTQIVFAGMQNSQNVAAGTLGQVEKKLSALNTMYEAKAWPSGKDVLNYVKSWVAHGRRNLENDAAPWEGDADLED